MFPKRLHPGCTIGLASPSHIATPEGYAPIIDSLETMGVRVKTAANLFSSAWGYSASDVDRAADLSQLILDDEVDMIFFGGGEGADEVAPLIDYAAVKAHPKLWLGFSDGTSILNAVHGRTGLPVLYGFSPKNVVNITEYNRIQFENHVLGHAPERHVASGSWQTITSGKAEGILSGGYLENYSFIANAGWIAPKPNEKYVLFLEEHETFFGVPHVSDELGRLEQSPLMRQVAGVLFGHYSVERNEQLLERLERLGQKNGIPVAYCDDFGHGANHAIFPIGTRAILDTAAQTLEYPDLASPH